MSALEELAQAILDGRVSVTTWVNGENSGRPTESFIVVAPKPDDQGAS